MLGANVSAIVAIPARLKSTRFPRKVLADIHGRPMLWYVYKAAQDASSIEEVWVLTDSEEVYEVASSWGANVLMTEEDCPSGSARIASVINKLDADIVVNVQGDEPLLPSSVIDTLVQAMDGRETDVATPVYKITNPRDLTNPNIVKVVRGSDGTGLYFSRSTIPFVRDVDPANWNTALSFWGHTGVYAYRRSVLLEYSSMPLGILEQAEQLEQLRLLETGKRILTVEIDYHSRGVDIPSDLDLVKGMITPPHDQP
jgi:3-deoxy-manno-octulosonate cytidylyltransferase (CMP-KDO synthetase)